jgi:hypothetical protein
LTTLSWPTNSGGAVTPNLEEDHHGTPSALPAVARDGRRLRRPVRLLGGVGYAAIVLPANSVGTRQLKKNAVTSAKVKRYSLLRNDFRRGQVPRGPQGIQGAAGAKGAKGDPGTPAIKLWAYVSYTGALRGGSGVTATSHVGQGNFTVTFNQSIVYCAAIASYERECGRLPQHVKSLLGNANRHIAAPHLYLELNSEPIP